MWYPDLLAVPVVGATAAIVAFGWFRHRERLAALTPAASAESAAALAERLAHLEAQVARVTQAVDAVAVEVERVGEGQRFIAAQLAERPPALRDVPAPARGRVVTPH